MEFVKEGKYQDLHIEQLQKWNIALYEDILPSFYKKSFANPLIGIVYGRETMNRSSIKIGYFAISANQQFDCHTDITVPYHELDKISVYYA